MTEHAEPNREMFCHWCQEVCRYGDTDRQGHVNNVVFATFCETGRVLFLRGGDTSLAPDGHEFVLARQTINFRRELLWGHVVDIGTAVTELGTSSFTTVQGLYRGADCVAFADSVIVLINTHTRRAVPLPPDIRAKLLPSAHASVR
jgi:acyl-CoA thioester hydrolase